MHPALQAMLAAREAQVSDAVAAQLAAAASGEFNVNTWPGVENTPARSADKAALVALAREALEELTRTIKRLEVEAKMLVQSSNFRLEPNPGIAVRTLLMKKHPTWDAAAFGVKTPAQSATWIRECETAKKDLTAIIKFTNATYSAGRLMLPSDTAGADMTPAAFIDAATLTDVGYTVSPTPTDGRFELRLPPADTRRSMLTNLSTHADYLKKYVTVTLPNLNGAEPAVRSIGVGRTTPMDERRSPRARSRSAHEASQPAKEARSKGVGRSTPVDERRAGVGVGRSTPVDERGVGKGVGRSTPVDERGVGKGVGRSRSSDDVFYSASSHSPMDTDAEERIKQLHKLVESLQATVAAMKRENLRLRQQVARLTLATLHHTVGTAVSQARKKAAVARP